MWVNGRIDHVDDSTNAGPDGQLGTADDVITSTDSYDFDSNGQLIAILSHPSAGPDGVWGTADDPTNGALETHCGNAMAITELGATAAGPDGVWGTADDVVEPTRTVLTGDGCGLSCVPPVY